MLTYRNLSRQIIRAFYEVYNELGAGSIKFEKNRGSHTGKDNFAGVFVVLHALMSFFGLGPVIG